MPRSACRCSHRRRRGCCSTRPAALGQRAGRHRAGCHRRTRPRCAVSPGRAARSTGGCNGSRRAAFRARRRAAKLQPCRCMSRRSFRPRGRSRSSAWRPDCQHVFWPRPRLPLSRPRPSGRSSRSCRWGHRCRSADVDRHDTRLSPTLPISRGARWRCPSGTFRRDPPDPAADPPDPPDPIPHPPRPAGQRGRAAVPAGGRRRSSRGSTRIASSARPPPMPNGQLAVAFAEALARTAPTETFAVRARALFTIPGLVERRCGTRSGRAVAALPAADGRAAGRDRAGAGAARPRSGAAQHRRAARDEHARSCRHIWSGSTPRWDASCCGAAIPADLSATYFDRFWDAAGAPGRPPDIDPIAPGATAPLGDGSWRRELRDARAQRAAAPLSRRDHLRDEGEPKSGTRSSPAGSRPTCATSASTSAWTRSADWSIVIQEHPSAPRFGVEVGDRHRDGDARAAAARRMPRSSRIRLRQMPVRITIPATVCWVDADADPGRRPRRRCSATAAAGPAAFERRAGPVRRFRWRCSRCGWRRASSANGAARPRLSRQGAHRLARSRRSTPTRSRGASDSGSCSGGRRRRSSSARPGGCSPAGSVPERAAWVARALTPTNLADASGRHARLSRPRRSRHDDAHAEVRAAPGSLGRDGVRRVERPSRSATGRDIEPDLAIGPDLERRRAPSTTSEPAVDEGMRWMVDFDRAEEVGMALRMTLPDAGVDVLLVTGVATGDSPTALAAQLDAHRYTDGLAFMPPASPTNNTAAGRTPYQEPDPQHEQELRPRVARPPTRRRAATPTSRRRRSASTSFARLAVGAGPGRRAARGDGDRALAGDVGLLPRADDRLRRDRTHRRGPRLGSRRTRSTTCGPAVRCRCCASVASHTVCCR